jgi:hypothetical protein
MGYRVPLLSNFIAALRSLAKPSLELPEPLYPDATTELALFARLIADPALGTTLKTLGVRQADIEPRLAAQVIRQSPESKAALNRVRASAIAASAGAYGKVEANRIPQEDLLAYLITKGSPGIRQVMVSCGIAPSAVVFWLAHHNNEDALRSSWPSDQAAGSRVAVVNDPYSPMEAVHRCLAEAFRLSEEEAIALMLRVHHEGTVHLDLPAGLRAGSFCDSCNRQWRSSGIPLYVRPVAI